MVVLKRKDMRDGREAELAAAGWSAALGFHGSV